MRCSASHAWNIKIAQIAGRTDLADRFQREAARIKSLVQEKLWDAPAGFFKVLQPVRYGGFELAPRVYCEIARTLAEGCMSSAWVYGVIAVHNWQMALLAEEAAQEGWGANTNVRISAAYMPVGKVKPVPGG